MKYFFLGSVAYTIFLIMVDTIGILFLNINVLTLPILTSLVISSWFGIIYLAIKK